MLQLIRGQGGNLGFQISKKNFEEGIEDLPFVTFPQIPFSGLGEEVENEQF